MDNKQDILKLLRSVADGATSPEDALLSLKEEPFADLDYAKIDFHRSIRQGASEVIYGAGKTPEQIRGIVAKMGRGGCRNILVTRIGQEAADALARAVPAVYYPVPRLAIAFPQKRELKGNIVVATGGTSDMAVAEEAALTAEAWEIKWSGSTTWAWPACNRLLSHLDELMSARCVGAVAGMEGALASVVGGLVDCPVVAVPTSVGYGASFGGLSALLSMLNSCASGCSVVNIDNGFGAGYLASMINQMEGIREE